MKTLLVLSALIAACLATPRAGLHDGFVAKWFPIKFVPNTLYDIPRTKAEVDSDKITWVEVPGDAGDPFTIHCQEDNERFCIILDLNGFIAGEQYSIPDEDTANTNGSYPFELNPSFRRLVRFGRDVWTATAFFVSPSVLDAGGRNDLSEGTFVELWIQKSNKYSEAVKIPLDRAELVSTTRYVLCGCIKGMGIHYYDNMGSNGSCTDFDPWFLMYNGNDFVGLGFQNFGETVVRPGIRNYDEDVPLSAVQAVIPDGPQCLFDWVVDYSAISLHTFFISDPLGTIVCA
ncbi:uncharacterized protein LOC132193638 [Neocloeon triangulifer]|uniref:uncharacterized protein LOC132193638 n=1 Tax=Neocloeon triangulifer TaxID=2078957 RepID=UPI00286F4CC9|nr:uncharacterized protein LOC132193638 [Neocloeon triangulifer]